MIFIEIRDRFSEDGVEYPYYRVGPLYDNDNHSVQKLEKLAIEKGLRTEKRKLDSVDTAMQWMRQL